MEDHPAGAAARLGPLLAPRSVALVGASPREGSYGRALLENAVGGGYRGGIHPVNPRHREGLGLRFHARLADVPGPPEHAVLAVSNERLEDALAEAAACGVRAVTVFASAHGAARGGGDLAARVRDLAREAGLLVCGPNSMGFHNLRLGLRITPFPVPLDREPGPIGAILQSGSVMGALAHNDRRLRFAALVSTGSECTVTAADYLRWMIEQPGVGVVAMFLEAVRDPPGFLAALEEADRRRLPVVILKVGRTERSRRMAVSHTGAAVGDHAVFAAAARERGAHLVDSLDDLAATAALFAAGRPAAPGGLATIHDSGGERELLADLAADLEVPLAPLGAATVARIAPRLEPGLVAENPLDAWGSGSGARETFRESFAAMMDDPAVAAGFYVLDWRGDYHLHEMHEAVLADVAAATAKPVAAVSNYSMSLDAAIADRLADRGVPLLEGTPEALRAARHLLAHRDRRRRERVAHRPHPRAAHLARAIPAGGLLGEAEGLALLAAYGIAVAPFARAADAGAAVEAAEALGYPVVLKTAAPGIAHKTERGGVRLGLGDAAAVRAAFADLAARLGPEVLVCREVRGEAEWALGVVNDRDFGPAVAIGPGGVAVDLVPGRAVLTAPFDAGAAAGALRGLRAARLLEGLRGRPPLAAGALCEAAARLSRLAFDLRERILELDVNPVIVSAREAVAVDVLVRGRD